MNCHVLAYGIKYYDHIPYGTSVVYHPQTECVGAN